MSDNIVMRQFSLVVMLTFAAFPLLAWAGPATVWDAGQKWEIKTSSGKIPAGWQPFAFDSFDESDPVLIRRCTTDAAAAKQKWEIKTSSGEIPAGWEPFAYDSKQKLANILIPS